MVQHSSCRITCRGFLKLFKTKNLAFNFDLALLSLFSSGGGGGKRGRKGGGRKGEGGRLCPLQKICDGRTWNPISDEAQQQKFNLIIRTFPLHQIKGGGREGETKKYEYFLQKLLSATILFSKL